MDKQKKEPPRIRSLADLRRAITPGTEIKATYHAYHPELVGLTRTVTEVRSNCFYSKIKDQPNHKLSVCNNCKGFRSDFEKASCYEFDGSTIRVLNSRKNDGSVLFEMELYSPENNMKTTETEKNDMNKYEAERSFAERMKKTYPAGTRIELDHMDDPFAPVPSGTRGTVQYVDDSGQLGMKFDNGRGLSLIPGEDSFHKLSPEEIEAEQQNNEQDEDNAPVLGM